MTAKPESGYSSSKRWLSAGSLALVVGAALSVATAPATCAPEAEAARPAETTDSVQAGPPPIPTEEISQRVAEDEARLQEIRLALEASDPSVVEIETGLPQAAGAIDRLSSAPESQTLDQLSLSRLSNLYSVWERQGTTLTDWQGRLQRRSKGLSDTTEMLRGMRATWTRTHEVAAAARAPRAFLDRIDSLLLTESEVEFGVRERLAALLTLQNGVSRELARVKEARQRIAAAEEQVRRRLFSLDSDPLWTALRGPHPAGDLEGQVQEAWRVRKTDLGRFIDENAARVRVHVGLFGLLLLAALVLRRRSRRWALEAAPLEPSARLLGRPVAAALVLALAATRFLYQAQPLVVYELLLLALIAPILRLFPRTLIARMRLSLYGLAGLFAFDRVRDLAAGQPVLHRLLLIAIGALGLAFFVWVAWRRGPAVGAWGGWARLAVGLARVATLPLGAALLANLVGAVSLAEMLTTATLTSAYVAVALLAAVLVLDAMVALSLRTGPAASVGLVRLHGEGLRRWSGRIINGGAFLLWLRVTLTQLGIYYSLMTGATQVLTRRWRYGEFNVSIGDLLRFAVVMGIGFILSRVIPLVLEEGIRARSSIPLGLRATISTLARVVLLSMGFLAALAAAGIGLGQFALIAGALGVGIGFGLQNLVSNFVSGLILAFERPVQVGDTVQVGALVGRVRRMGLRSSTVRTAEGSEVIVPNANLISNEVVNWTLSDATCRVELPVGVAGGTDPRRVLEILLGVARENPEVLKSPAPAAQFRGFGDGSLNFVIQFWTPSYDDGSRLSSEVGVAIHDALKQAGIESPSPQRDLHLKSVTPAAGSALGGLPSDPKAEGYERG